jgi:hypothetical protein
VATGGGRFSQAKVAAVRTNYHVLLMAALRTIWDRSRAIRSRCPAVAQEADIDAGAPDVRFLGEHAAFFFFISISAASSSMTKTASQKQSSAR